ncbi:uncharacterized protein [Amphiura filiformis]|uniref:uncharacterized protein n=1 Tax=Amphiura filiformis TaxID=82378 RepID=UPI003B222EE3
MDNKTMVLCSTTLVVCLLVNLGHTGVTNLVFAELFEPLPSCYTPNYTDDHVRELGRMEGIDFKTISDMDDLLLKYARGPHEVESGCEKTCRFVPVNNIYKPNAGVINMAAMYGLEQECDDWVPVNGESTYQYVYACKCSNPGSSCVNCDNSYHCQQEYSWHRVMFRSCHSCSNDIVKTTQLPTACSCKKPGRMITDITWANSGINDLVLQPQRVDTHTLP